MPVAIAITTESVTILRRLPGALGWNFSRNRTISRLNALTNRLQSSAGQNGMERHCPRWRTSSTVSKLFHIGGLTSNRLMARKLNTEEEQLFADELQKEKPTANDSASDQFIHRVREKRDTALRLRSEE